MTATFRSARSGEEEALAELADRAFHVAGIERARWTAYFTSNQHLSLSDVVVADEGGAIVGCLARLRLHMTLAGEDVPFTGIAAVAVAPEARRRGVGEELVRAALHRGRDAGEALSGLFAFRYSFYRKLGYGQCEQRDLLRVGPRQLPGSLLRERVRRFDIERDFAAIRRAYDVARAGTTGQLRRSETWWERQVFHRNPECVVYVEPGARVISGYAIYEVPPEPEYPRQDCRVRELVAATPDAHAGLIGFLAALSDQVRVVELPLPRGLAQVVLSDHGGSDALDLHRGTDLVGYAQVGACMRLLDLPAAIALHPLPRRRSLTGAVGLDVTDPLDSGPSSFDVELGGGAAARRGASAPDRLALTVDRLAQIYFGASTATAMLARGLVTGSERAAELVDAAFAGGPPMFLGPSNHF